MLRKLASFLKSRAGKLAEFDKLKARLDAVVGNSYEVAATYGNDLASTYQTALAEFFDTGSKEALEKFVSARTLCDTWNKVHVVDGLRRHIDQTQRAIKNEPGSRAIMGDCLHQVGLMLNEANEAAFADVQQSYAKLGVTPPTDLGAQEPFATLRSRAVQVTDAIALLAEKRPLDHGDFDRIFALIETAADVPVYTRPAPSKLPEGMITTMIRTKNELAALGPIFDDGHEARVLAVPQDAPRRASFSPPQLFEDSIEKDADGKPCLVRRPVSFEEAARPAMVPGQATPVPA